MTEAEFVNLMTKKLANVDVVDYIRSVFLALDRSGHGFITLEDLSAHATQWTPFIPLHVIARSFAEVDNNRDGKLGGI
ncbi:hypothetical protein HDU97_009077 [Phlyctochytrium planicorne]|nr:hypothetical protein HDU97_009077 [Phlyctochytrium planicorne]